MLASSVIPQRKAHESELVAAARGVVNSREGGNKAQVEAFYEVVNIRGRCDES